MTHQRSVGVSVWRDAAPERSPRLLTRASTRIMPSAVPWRDVAIFVALAYGLSWAWWAPIVWPYLHQITLNRPLPNVVEAGSIRVPVGMFGPLLAATIMRLFVSREGLRGTLGFIRPWKYYVVAVAAPACFIAGILFVDQVSGIGRFTPPRPLSLAVPIVVLVDGAFGVPLTLGEEYGWRGYLLPRLLPLGEITATLVLALIWAMWHLPILLIGLNYPEQPLTTVLPVFTITVVLMAFPFTWLYVQSRCSVIAVAVMHAVLNAAGDTFTSPRYLEGNPVVVSAGGLISATCLLVVVIVYGARRYGVDAGDGD